MEEVTRPRGRPRKVDMSVTSPATFTLEEPVQSLDNPGDPNQAAQTLLYYLPQNVQDLILEARASRDVPLWQMLLGYVMQCADGTTLFAPHILTLWNSGRPANALRPCRKCGGMFRAQSPDAEYCCSYCYFDKLQEKKGHHENCLIAKTQAGIIA